MMRNQTWDQDGKLVADVELKPGDPPTATDHIAGSSRPAKGAEVELLAYNAAVVRRAELESELARRDLTPAEVSELLRLERGS